jgi:hypothetical protein
MFLVILLKPRRKEEMSKKLVVSLFAGAVLLSAGAGSAFAGVVAGACVNCHTMHNSQDGATMTGTVNAQLLGAVGCQGCHGQTNANTGNNGMADQLGQIPMAPQVGDASSAKQNAGGYFTLGGINATVGSNQHNVSDIGNGGDATIIAGGNVVPGGDAATAIGLGTTGAGNANLTCSDCHSRSGHHTTVANTYRLLSGDNASTGHVNYGAGSFTRTDNLYNATDMNNFCALCHGDFHGTTNQVVSSGVWKRHPTDLRVQTSAGPSIVAINRAGSNDQVVVGTDGTNDDVLMCLSCHVAHGGAFPDLLAFAYNTDTNVASKTGGTASTGCETCHSYGSSGM